MAPMHLKGNPGSDARPAFRIQKAFWGYVVRSLDGPPVMLQIAQGFVLVVGATFAAAALALVAPPEVTPGLGSTRTGLAIVLASMATLLVWFATRGGAVELQFDLARGELRELVRHRLGRATVVGRHGFGGDAALLLDRRDRGDGSCRLVLRLREGEQGLCIAEGPEAALLELRRRLDPELRMIAARGRGAPYRAAA